MIIWIINTHSVEVGYKEALTFRLASRAFTSFTFALSSVVSEMVAVYCCLSNTVGALSLGTDTITCTVALRGVGRAWSDACTVNCKNRWLPVYMDHYTRGLTRIYY